MHRAATLSSVVYALLKGGSLCGPSHVPWLKDASSKEGILFFDLGASGLHLISGVILFLICPK